MRPSRGLPPLAAARVVAAWLSWLEPTAAVADEPGWVPFELRDGSVTFPVVVGAAEGRAVLDTGAALYGIEAGLLERARLEANGAPVRVSGAFTYAKTLPTVTRLPIRMLGVDVELRNVPVLPSSGDTLLIGTAFVDGFIVQLDYPGSRMRRLPREAMNLARHANVEMRREADSGRPTVQVTFGEKDKRWLLLDTGNQGPLVLHRGLAEELGVERFRKGSKTLSDVNAGMRDLELLVLPQLRIGPFELGDVQVAIPREGERLHLGQRRAQRATGSHMARGVRVQGVLGYEVLRHFVVTIDYERNKLHLAPLRAPGEPTQEDAPGAEKAKQ